MTANRTPVDLDAIERQAELTLRGTMLLTDVRRTVAELRTLRTSIGPDGERGSSNLDQTGTSLDLGPDDIVVSREIADKALRHAWVAHDDATVAALRAALSQPHPAQEQQT